MIVKQQTIFDSDAKAEVSDMAYNHLTIVLFFSSIKFGM